MDAVLEGYKKQAILLVNELEIDVADSFQENNLRNVVSRGSDKQQVLGAE